MKRKIISLFLLVSIIVACGTFSSTTVKAASVGHVAFKGPFAFVGTTTTTYRYFEENANDNSNSSTRNTVDIDETKTVTITEDQTLTYWLHTPIHYDSKKNYPVMVYCSGSGCTIFEHENFQTVRSINTDSEEFQNSPYSKFYRQSVYYGPSFWLCGYRDINGNWVGSTTVPGNYTESNAAFLEQWYDLVYMQGKEEYDCFIIYVQPEDEAWWENHSNLKALCIHTMAQAKEICEEYGDDIVTYAGGNYNSGYVASELSANVFSQLTVQLIDKLAEDYNIDLKRQYISGFSLGAQFSFDTICHYPDRFACSIFSGLPASDVTESNAKNLTNMNIWTFNGTSDFCNKNFSLGFVDKVDAAKTTYGGVGEAKATVCSGGHSGSYLTGNQTYSSGDTYSKGSTEVIDFMFGSIRSDMNVQQTLNDKSSLNGVLVSAKSSITLIDDKYDLVLVSGAPLGNFDEHGFVITTSEKLNVGKDTIKVPVSGMVSNYEVTLGNNSYMFKATDYGSVYIYTFIITDIPKDVTSFIVQAYASNQSDIYYSKKIKLDIVITDGVVSLEVTK